ncbi:MAG: hypothetical protein Q4G09_07150 [Clostridia bacterium]|nr:hypothetical protein [Clostridia bacterium]
MIKLEKVSFKYKNSDNILEDINLEIQEGECISIIGKNGSRKIYYGKINIRARNTNKREYYN